ncbi:MAG: hypothetical protein ACT4P3_01275 [Betaproteobacteria bacterium]
MKATLRALGCRLCWRVTGGVFASILLIESLVLVPSTMRFEDEALRRLAFEAEVAVDAMLARGPAPDGAHALLAGLQSLVGRRHVQGLAARMADGTVIEAGEHVELAFSGTAMRYSPERGHLEVTWVSNGAPAASVLAARLDASEVARARNAYVLRIAGIVTVIVLFVTAGTMLVLHFIVLAR